MKTKLTIALSFLSMSVGSATFKSENNLPFSEANLIRTMTNIGIKYPDVVLAQARIETGHFTSRIFKENNNIFGMKLPKKRETTAMGKRHGHADYASWRQSVVDYKMWQDFMTSKIKSKEDYIEYLSLNYAEDKNYVNKLKQLK